MSHRKKQQQQEQHDFLPNYASNGKKPLGPARRIGLPRNVRPSPNGFKSPMITSDSSEGVEKVPSVASTPPSSLLGACPRIGLSRIIKPSQNAFKSPMLTPRLTLTPGSDPKPELEKSETPKVKPRKSVRRNILDADKEKQKKDDDKGSTSEDDSKMAEATSASSHSSDNDEDAQELLKSKKTQKRGAKTKAVKTSKGKKGARKCLSDEETDETNNEENLTENQDGDDEHLSNASNVSNKSDSGDKQEVQSVQSPVSPDCPFLSPQQTPVKDTMPPTGRARRASRKNTEEAKPGADKQEIKETDGKVQNVAEEASPDCPVLSPQSVPLKRRRPGRPKKTTKPLISDDEEEKNVPKQKKAEVKDEPDVPIQRKSARGKIRNRRISSSEEEDVAPAPKKTRPAKTPKLSDVTKDKLVAPAKTISSSSLTDEYNVPLVTFSKQKPEPEPETTNRGNTLSEETPGKKPTLVRKVSTLLSLKRSSIEVQQPKLDKMASDEKTDASKLSDMEAVTQCNLKLEMARNEVSALEIQVLEKEERVEAFSKRKQRVAELDALTKRFETASKEALVQVHQKITAMGENIDMDMLLRKFNAPEDKFQFDAFEYAFV